MNDKGLENRMMFPYAPDDAEEFVLDEDSAYELERQQEIDEAGQKSARTRHADRLCATLLDLDVARIMRSLRQAS